jgi:hypothetical protein
VASSVGELEIRRQFQGVSRPRDGVALLANLLLKLVQPEFPALGLRKQGSSSQQKNRDQKTLWRQSHH